MKKFINQGVIAANRFGYGACRDEVILASVAPINWLKSQLQPPTFSDEFPTSEEILQQHFKFTQNKNSKRKTINKVSKNYARKALVDMSADTIMRTINSSNSVSWKLLDFFSNHFSVSANGRLMTGLAATLEREAIAPNLLGRFEDLLIAVEQHPAMLIYLNNERSFGENSRLGKKRKTGLNENLAREILELHTLGVNGPYRQHDVTELAKAITGWSVVNLKREQGSGFKFRSFAHEPGNRKLLGKKYQAGGINQGEQMLRDIAVDPATAKYICFKLAHHFVSEQPEQTLLKRMETTWHKTKGNIKQVMFTLFEAPESWVEQPQKFKSPRELLISSLRALASKPLADKLLFNSLISLGQQPFNSGSPAGYSDQENDWLGASALMARIDWVSRVASYRKRVNAETIMKSVLGNTVSELTYQSVLRAESRKQALILLFMSPEFQRR
ncbi:DUF1800 domain-containing protein [Thalassotalea sp. SU-HH00458]|uniref:DUF1800 domain-containing protein n=1 Tax=Thalassotalea sp. SU-HH00458 TaxID=3127657 RepID=UPI003365A27A